MIPIHLLREKNKMIHAEFLGLPGSGKTTIIKHLVKRLQRIDRERYLSEDQAFLQVSRLKIDKIYRLILKILPKSIASEFIEKLKDRSLMQINAQNRFLAHRGDSLSAFLDSEIFQILSGEDRKILITGFLQVASIFECLHDQLPDDRAVLFEEGFVQKSFMFISCRQDNPDKEKAGLLRYLNSIPLPDLVIYVNSDMASCYKRMLSRPTGLTDRLKRTDPESVHTFLDNAGRHIDFLISWIRNNQKINLLEIDNNAELDESLQELTPRVIDSISFAKKKLPISKRHPLLVPR